MTTVDKIRRLENRRKRLESMLEDTEGHIHDAVVPVFRALLGVTWALALDSMKLTDTHIIVEIGHPSDSPRRHSLPHSVFEADDPRATAKEIGESRRREDKENQRRAEQRRLLRRLEELGP